MVARQEILPCPLVVVPSAHQILESRIASTAGEKGDSSFDRDERFGSWRHGSIVEDSCPIAAAAGHIAAGKSAHCPRLPSGVVVGKGDAERAVGHRVAVSIDHEVVPGVRVEWLCS